MLLRCYTREFPRVAPAIVEGIKGQIVASDVFSSNRKIAETNFEKTQLGCLPQVVVRALNEDPLQRPGLDEIFVSLQCVRVFYVGFSYNYACFCESLKDLPVYFIVSIFITSSERDFYGFTWRIVFFILFRLLRKMLKELLVQNQPFVCLMI